MSGLLDISLYLYKAERWWSGSLMQHNHFRPSAPSEPRNSTRQSHLSVMTPLPSVMQLRTICPSLHLPSHFPQRLHTPQCVGASIDSHFRCIRVGLHLSAAVKVRVSRCPKWSPALCAPWPRGLRRRNPTSAKKCSKKQTLSAGGTSGSQATLSQLLVVLPKSYQVTTSSTLNGTENINKEWLNSTVQKK